MSFEALRQEYGTRRARALAMGGPERLALFTFGDSRMRERGEKIDAARPGMPAATKW